MNNFGENIKDYLLQFKDMPANHFTSGLKQMSGSENGTMVDGVIKIIDQLIYEKKKSTTTAFFVGIFSGSALVGSVFLIRSKYIEKKKHGEECQKIIKTFENEIALGKSDTNPIAEKAYSDTDNAMICG